jgi:hypothetical protein
VQRIHDYRVYRKVALALALSVAMLAVVAPVDAATTTQTTSVSCDGVTIKSGVTVTHDPSGTFKITQNSTNPTSITRTYARSSNGNDLTIKTVANGGTATWTGVLASNYTVKAFRSSAANCNGWLPGHGNYSWNYTVTYQ